jgi:hypothetical protein
MADDPIHVAPDENFDDWTIRDKNCEYGHYPTREKAELRARNIAEERKTELVIHLPDGRTIRESFQKAGYLA